VVTLHQGGLVQLAMLLVAEFELAAPLSGRVAAAAAAAATAQHDRQGAPRPRDACVHRRPSRQRLDASRACVREGAPSTRSILAADNTSNAVEGWACRRRGHRHSSRLATRRPTPIRKDRRSAPVTPGHDEESDLLGRPGCLI
jgi:hypothetical protein